MSFAYTLCECGARATASAYGLALCIRCYVEQGFANPALLGGRPPSDDELPDDDGEADR